MLECPDCANQANYSHIVHADIDSQAESLAAFDQDYMQIDNGPFSGTMATCDFGTGLIVSFEHINRRILQLATIPKDTLQIALILESDTPSVFKSVLCSKNMAVMMAPESETQLNAAAGMKICLVSIMGGAAAKLRQDYGINLSDFCDDVFLEQNQTHSLRGLVSEAYERFSNIEQRGSIADFEVSSFQNAILGLTAWAYSGQRNEKLNLRQLEKTHGQLFNQALHLIERHYADDISPDWLAEKLSISRRSLEMIFANIVDMGPSRFIKIKRLNMFRKHLVNRRDSSIGDVAAQCGLWHLGRVAAEFKKMFGILPSELQRGGDTER